jgi:hypothetical protein
MSRKIILAIDPGNEFSAFTLYKQRKILNTKKLPNAELIELIKTFYFDVGAIEMVASYGMAVGKTVFETCVWIGRFEQVIADMGLEVHKVYRKDVKMHLCGSNRAKDSNIRQAILDSYPATGGGSTPQVGTKKEPGPLYGVSKDMWASLGVAITFEEAICS